MKISKSTITDIKFSPKVPNEVDYLAIGSADTYIYIFKFPEMKATQ